MTFYIVTWTFMRHIHRHREYKILTKQINTAEKHLAEFKMMYDEDVQSLFKLGFKHKLKDYTKITIGVNND